MKILLIEDSPTNLMWAQNALDSELVTVCTNIECALDALSVINFDVIILDMKIPSVVLNRGLDNKEGYDLIRAINTTTPIVVWSGYSHPELRKAIVEEGSTYIIKGDDPIRLLEEVKNGVAGFKARQKLNEQLKNFK